MKCKVAAYKHIEMERIFVSYYKAHRDNTEHRSMYDVYVTDGTVNEPFNVSWRDVLDPLEVHPEVVEMILNQAGYTLSDFTKTPAHIGDLFINNGHVYTVGCLWSLTDQQMRDGQLCYRKRIEISCPDDAYSPLRFAYTKGYAIDGSLPDCSFIKI